MDQVHDKVLEAYLGEMGEDFMLATRERVHWVCRMTEGSRVLDVGCSQGIVPILLGREGLTVTGLDVDPQAVAEAQGHLQRQNDSVGARVSFQLADFMEWQPPSTPYDTVVMSEVIEHLTRPEGFIKKAAEVLKAGGAFVVTVPFGINDYIDHKRTYYAFEVIDLAAPFFELQEVEIFGKWIGFRFQKREQGKEDPTRAWPWALLYRVEEAFYKMERALTKELSASRTALKNARREGETLRSEHGQRISEIVAVKDGLVSLTGTADEVLNSVARLDKRVDEIRSDVSKSSADALSGTLEIADRLATIELAIEALRRRGSELVRHISASEQRVVERGRILEEISKNCQKMAEAAANNEKLVDLVAERDRAISELLRKMESIERNRDELSRRLDSEKVRARQAALLLDRVKRSAALREERFLRAQSELSAQYERRGQLIALAAERYETVLRSLATVQRSAKYRVAAILTTSIRAGRPLSGLKKLREVYSDWRKFRTSGDYGVELPGPDAELLKELTADSLRHGSNVARLERVSGDDPTGYLLATACAPLYLEDSVFVGEVEHGGWSDLSLEGLELTVSTHGASELLIELEVESVRSVDVTLSVPGRAAALATVQLVPDGAVRYALRARVPKSVADVTIGLVSSEGRLRNRAGLRRFFEGASVIVPTYRGRETLERALRSVAEQDVPASMLELIVVMNGEADGSAEILERFVQEFPELDIQCLELAVASAGGARNAGLAVAQREYLLFLDDDDALGPKYVSTLLASASPWTVTVTELVDYDGEEVRDSAVGEQVRSARPLRAVTPSDIAGAMTMNACKLLPSGFAAQQRFVPGLRSGEDVHYFALLVARFDPEIVIAEHDEDGRYIRSVRANSVSRQVESYDFSVLQRLDVVESVLRDIPEHVGHSARKFVLNALRSQMQFACRYIGDSSARFSEFAAEVRRRKLGGADCIRWLNQRLAETLVISYCFPPYIDTAGIVMAKRIRVQGRPVDVISNRMDGTRRADPRLNDLVSDVVGHQFQLDAPVSFGSWPAIRAFSEEALLTTKRLIATRGRPYSSIHSRAMWPASHFAAALIKASWPDTKWVAEFSDPVRVDMAGKDRGGIIEPQWLEQLGLAEVARKVGVGLPSADGLFAWCEYVAYLMADELVFTNRNQMEYMLSYLKDPELALVVRQKARISPHPTLPEEFYAIAQPVLPNDDHKVRLAYFGSFYESRGLGGILSAVAQLAPSVRDKLSIHVYSDQPEGVTREPAFEAVADQVRLHRLVGYLEFLRLTTEYDCLVVCDAMTAGVKVVNPYLPSKISDYLGSGSDIWALVEPGSALAHLANDDQRITYRSELYDVARHVEVLTEIVSRRRTGEDPRGSEGVRD